MGLTSEEFDANLNHVKHQNFTYIPSLEILWKRTVSAEFRID